MTTHKINDRYYTTSGRFLNEAVDDFLPGWAKLTTATCDHCHTTLYAEDLATAPLCDLCHAAEHNRIAAGREYTEQFGDINEDRNEPASGHQHAEVTPAGLNYLLPGVDPIHTTTQGEGQQRLL